MERKLFKLQGNTQIAEFGYELYDNELHDYYDLVVHDGVHG